MMEPLAEIVDRRALHDWVFRPSPKYAAYGVVRTIPPAQTIRRVLPLMPCIGVTRIGELTQLDRVGVPNYTTVRPAGRDGISYYNGKGTTRPDAKAGALMEAIERYSAETHDLPVEYGTRAEIERLGPAVDPAEMIVPQVRVYAPDVRLEWVPGFDLLAQRPTFVPLNMVVCPYDPPPGRQRLWYASSNGLASGNTIEEATCHALCEIIERDAEALAHTALELKPAVDQVLAGLGLAASAPPPLAHQHFPLLALDTLPTRAAAIAGKLLRAGLKVYLRSVTSTVGIATLDCTIVERQLNGLHRAFGGCGTHPDARVAATRALTEAAQSRLGCIQGGREDLPDFVKPPADWDPDVLYGRGQAVSFASIPSYQHDDIADDIRFLLRRMAEAGFTQAIAVELTRPELGVPVVRMVVPRAESWTVFHMHARRGAFGSRSGEILGSQGEPPN